MRGVLRERELRVTMATISDSYETEERSPIYIGYTPRKTKKWFVFVRRRVLKIEIAEETTSTKEMSFAG